MRKWKTFLKRHKLSLSKAISTMTHLMTQPKEAARRLCVLLRSQLGGKSSPLFIHSLDLEDPLPSFFFSSRSNRSSVALTSSTIFVFSTMLSD